MSLTEGIREVVAPQGSGRVTKSGNDTVQDAIIELILSRQLKPGDLLPNERELVEELAVGRNSVREAIKSLQALGIVTIRHGSGTYVASGSLDPLVGLLSFLSRISLFTDGRDANELVQVREAIEVELIPGAVAKTRPDDLARLRECVEEMEARARVGQPFTDLDMTFHAALYAPLGNRLLSELLRSFWLAYSSIADAVSDRDIDLVRTAADHRRIYDLVAKSDGAGAAEAIREHFDGIRARMRTIDGTYSV